MANEKRLIDANALDEAIRTDFWEHFTQCHDTDQTALIDMVCEDIGNAPTVDAVEVVHGRWEKAEYHGFLRCSECKDVYIDDTWVADGKWNYCPNCGAKMRGSEE